MESIHEANKQAAAAQEADAGMQFFLEGVRSLPGVQRVEIGGSRSPTERSLVVYVPEGDLETEQRVYGLEADAYHRYPNLRLDVWVEGTSRDHPLPQAPAPSE